MSDSSDDPTVENIETEELLENIDAEELLENIDIEETLQPEHLRKLLDRLSLESVFRGFGAAAGSEVGVRVGRRLDGLFGIGEGDAADGTEGDDAETATSDDDADGSGEDADAAMTDDGGETDETTADADEVDAQPESREDLEALSYRDLQALTKDTDVKGNISEDRMVDGLAEEFGFDDESTVGQNH